MYSTSAAFFARPRFSSFIENMILSLLLSAGNFMYVWKFISLQAQIVPSKPDVQFGFSVEIITLKMNHLNKCDDKLSTPILCK